MANIICHHNGKFNLYNTISDGFLFTAGVSVIEIREYIKGERGKSGLRGLDERVGRAIRMGCSSLPEENLDSLLCCNRAGENEEHLTTQQCIERFLS